MGRAKAPHPSRARRGKRAARSTLSPRERANAALGALRRAMAFSLAHWEMVAEARGRVRGLFPTVAVRPVQGRSLVVGLLFP